MTEIVGTPLSEHLYSVAEQVASIYLERLDVESIVALGSFTAGLGNRFSDLDLYVVSNAPDTSRPSMHHLDGVRVDVEKRPVGWLEEVVREAAQFSVTTKQVARLGRSNAHFDTVGRLYYATPMHDAGEFKRAHDDLVENLTDFRRHVMAREVFQLHGLLEDVLGALDADDLSMAAQLSQEFLRGALQAFLVGCGSVYLGKKWIPARLRAVAAPHTPVDELLALSTGPAGRSERDAAADRIRWAQSAVAAALTDGWVEPRAAEWRGWPTRGDGDAARALDWMPIRATDAVVLAQVRGRQFRISESALRIWGSHPAQTLPEDQHSTVQRLTSLDILR